MLSRQQEQLRERVSGTHGVGARDELAGEVAQLDPT